MLFCMPLLIFVGWGIQDSSLNFT